MFTIQRKLFVALMLGLIGILCGLVFIFLPPPSEMKKVVIFYNGQNETTFEFNKGLNTVLRKQGYYQGTNLKIFIESPGRKAEMIKLMKKYSAKKVDLFVLTEEEWDVSVEQHLLQQPIIFTWINNPIPEDIIKRIESAKSIIGISYFPPYRRTLDLAKRTFSNFNRVMILLPKDHNWLDYGRFKTDAESLGISVVNQKIDLTKPLNTGIIQGKDTDLIYLPGMPEFINQHEKLSSWLAKSKIPVISNNLVFKNIAVLNYFAEPKTMGEIAGLSIVKIFHQAIPEFMAVELSTDYKLLFNLSVLKEPKISENEDVLSYANQVIQ